MNVFLYYPPANYGGWQAYPHFCGWEMACPFLKSKTWHTDSRFTLGILQLQQHLENFVSTHGSHSNLLTKYHTSTGRLDGPGGTWRLLVLHGTGRTVDLERNQDHHPKGAIKPSSNQQEKAQNQSSPDKIEELGTHIRYDLNRFRLKSWLKILRNNQLWREIVSKKCFKVMRRWVTHGNCLPPIGVSEVIQDLWLVIPSTSLFPTWYISPCKQSARNLIYLVTSKNKITRASFLAFQTAPLHRKNIHGKDVSNKSKGETKAFTNDKAKLEKNAKGHKVGPNLASGWKCPPFADFPCWKRRISIVMVRVLEYSIFKFNYQLRPSDPDGSPK